MKTRKNTEADKDVYEINLDILKKIISKSDQWQHFKK